MSNQIKAMISAFIVYMASWFLLTYTVGNIYLSYLIGDVLSSFVYAIVFIPSGERAKFYSSPVFNYLFSTSMVYMLGISLIFVLIGLI